MTPTNDSVAIVLVNWNSFQLTSDCIQSLQNISYKNHCVIVVDNGSEDGSGEQLKSTYPNIVLIQSSKNLGFTGGNNLGMQYAIEQAFTYVLLLNNDTFVEPNFLEPLISMLEKDNSIGAVQPKIFFHHNRNLLWDAGSFYTALLGRTYTRGYQQKDHAKYNQVMQTDWITGCAFLVRTSVLKKTGLLPENLFIYYEDVDLSFRIRKLGYRLCYQPASVIYHIAGMAHKKKHKEGMLNPKVHYLNFRNRIWLLKAYTKPIFVPTVFLYNFFYTVGVMAYFVARLRFQKLRAVWKGIKDGFTGSIQYN